MRESSPLSKEYQGDIWRDSVPVSDGNTFNNALAVMDNLVARATTRWTLAESKIFICALSKIKTRDENNWVKLPKKDLYELLELKNWPTRDIRKLIKNVSQKSWFEFGNDEEWSDGFIVTRTKADRWNIYLKFESDYLPLLDQLSTKFTQVYVESIAGMSHKSSYNLYLYLKSWGNPNFLQTEKQIPKSEIMKIFNLKPGQYWRDWGTDKARFHWSDFERRALIPAIEEINSGVPGTSEIYIDHWEKVKKGKAVLGYDFYFTLVDKHGLPQ